MDGRTLRGRVELNVVDARGIALGQKKAALSSKGEGFHPCRLELRPASDPFQDQASLPYATDRSAGSVVDHAGAAVDVAKNLAARTECDIAV